METGVTALVRLGRAVGVVLLGITADQWGVAGGFAVTALPTAHQHCPDRGGPAAEGADGKRRDSWEESLTHPGSVLDHSLRNL